MTEAEPTQPRPRLWQVEAATRTAAIHARACTYCSAPIGRACTRTDLKGQRHELIFVHPCRLRPEGNTDA
ncbi:hypothetical protein NONO_c17640 [Nocardia nova SH22a]|uniref:DNA-binding phage zinc finger domain-containing protein n=1 Tax=Nocardia nova SH22a TaxID=1415166 RepID=W5TBM6_9NOCA|nr:hypothetical protein [Nocardia nova]AHH16564.1 hypothetical protein NONO_c17640 [Nocardia nova SH22a]